jgi:hypothetical protein
MQKFTGTGIFLTKWGSFGAGEGQFNLPYGIRAGANGIVYVSDSSNFRVQKFAFLISGDLNGDGDVDFDDLNALVAVLLGVPLDPAHVARADLNGDGNNDGEDIQLFVDAILAP